ncbi:hypothetical protein [Capnocytophaga sputigena]|uniref:hypothetical protein n=1 Tax=Capnocytophaga sputigena TaxID=1019 RepID=UPI0028D61178|nr:hypothetical protein [Capnocytophaga sputigena]
MKVYFLILSLFISTLVLAQENSFSQQDSIMLLSQLKDKSFKIGKKVTIDCIPSIDMHHSTTYSRAKVKKTFSAIFDEFFDRKLKEKDFKLFYYPAIDYNTTPETEHKLYGLVLKEYDGKVDDLLRIYWFEKKDNNFYFIWIECAIKNE